MARSSCGWALLLILISSESALAQLPTFTLSLHQAELSALKTSGQLKSFVAQSRAAIQQAKVQFSNLIPRISFDANYLYQAVVPTVSAPGFNLPFGANSSYSIGPALNYTLWDSFAAVDAYRGYSKLADARKADQKNARLQLLLQTRLDYVRVQEAVDELRLVNETLALSKAQNRDIHTRFRAGAASTLDRIESDRDVLSYQLQFRQKQAELTSDLKDLLAVTGQPSPPGISHPGPPGIPGVTLVLAVDSLRKSLEQESRIRVLPPDESQPRIVSQELTAQSDEFLAKSTKASLFPTVGLKAKTSIDYPNGPVLERVHQSTVSLNLTMPLFEMGRTRHQAEERLQQAAAARFQKDQIRTDLHRDFDKARELLESDRKQRVLASENVQESQEAARLYYNEYRAGKINLIDVQSANVRALQASVDAARIDAQMLDQIALMRATSGKELDHE